MPRRPRQSDLKRNVDAKIKTRNLALTPPQRIVSLFKEALASIFRYPARGFWRRTVEAKYDTLICEYSGSQKNNFLDEFGNARVEDEKVRFGWRKKGLKGVD